MLNLFNLFNRNKMTSSGKAPFQSLNSQLKANANEAQAKPVYCEKNYPGK